MATESSHLIRTPSVKRSRQANSEAETTLNAIGDGCVHSQGSVNRDTIDELHDLLGALETAKTAVQAQLDAQVATNIGRRPKPLIPRWVTKYLLLITFLGQTVTIGLIEVIQQFDKGANSTKTEVDLAGNVILTVLQAMHLILVFFVSFKVAKQVIHHTASGSLVAQAYLSTVLLFAGLYTLIYRFDPKGWNKVSDGRSPSPILLFLKMLFFSISTATLCGTSVIEPVEWYTTMLVGFQMLTSFVYFTSIMSVALTPRRRSQFDQPVNKARSFTRKIRQFVFGERQSRTYTI